MSTGRPAPSVPTSFISSETEAKRNRCIAAFDALSIESAESAEKTLQQTRYLETVVQALSIAATNLRNGTVEDTSEIGCLLEVLQHCASKMIAERQNTLTSGSLTGVQVGIVTRTNCRM
jgi:GAF domain-containing protein